MIYLFVLLFFALNFLFSDSHIKIRGVINLPLLLSLIFLILLAGFRFRVGFDTINYNRYFEEMESLSTLNSNSFLTDRFQPLWILLVAICKSIYPSIYILQLIISIFFNFSVFRVFSKFGLIGFFPIIIYFNTYYFFYNFEVMRESVAVSIFLFSFPYLVRRNWFQYIAFSFLAYLFHASAAVLLIIPLLSIISGRIVVYVFAIMFFTFLLFFSELMDFFIANIDLSSSFIYFDSYIYNFTNLNIIGLVAEALGKISLPLMLYYLSMNSESKLHVFRPLLLISALIGVVAIRLPIANRLNSYFFILYIMILSDYFYHFWHMRERRIFFYACLIVAVFSFYNNLFTVSIDPNDPESRYKVVRRYYPYYHILNPKHDEIREAYAF